jgi:hypothetical protein
MPRSLCRFLLPRLLTPRIPRRPPSHVGVCAACGVAFLAPAGRLEQTAELLRVHESICPGGDRAGEGVTPLD